MNDSGLMLANAVCYAVGKALQGIPGVNLGITAFPGVNAAKRGATVVPVLRHGEKLTTRFPVIAYGMTPMAESLWWVMQQMYCLRENRKIILIITDGEPDSIPAAQEAFKQAQKKSFECYGLGIMCSSIATLLSHTSRVIETLPLRQEAPQGEDAHPHYCAITEEREQSMATTEPYAKIILWEIAPSPRTPPLP